MKALTANIPEIKLSYKSTLIKGRVILFSIDAFKEMIQWFPEESIMLQERVIVAYLNNAKQTIGVFEAAAGGINKASPDIRLIMATALKVASVGLIIAHNHPSGNLNPSYADREFTLRLKFTAELFDIRLVDHIVISSNKMDYYSFSDQGFL